MSSHINYPHEEPPQAAEPEYIILDGEEEPKQQKPRSDMASLSALNVPIGVRILCLFGLIAAFAYAWLSLIALLIYIIFSVITLFKVPQFTQQVASSWKALKRGSTYVLGLFVSLMSPPLGFGILLMYSALHDAESGFVSQFVRSNMNRYGSK